MKCPACGFADSKVIDSRPTDNGGIRRRRECLKCLRRFTTYEVVESLPIIVVKRDGSRQNFDKSKILQGQVWRLFSWVFTDTLSINPLLNILFLYF